MRSPTRFAIASIAGGTPAPAHTCARLSDGTVVAWGNNLFLECNVPPLPAGLTYVEIAAGYWSSYARRSDGSVIAWGGGTYGATNVPALPAGITYVEISAGDWFAVARRSDGAVVAFGDNVSGQCNVPALPAGLAYIEISTGAGETEVDRLLSQISSYYVLGVEPEDRDRDGRPHRLEVKAGARNVQVKSRQLVVVPRRQ